jgi:hypothetical protein
MQTQAILGTIAVPLPSLARRQRQIERFKTAKAVREQAMLDAFQGQDVDALVAAVFNHVSHLYTRSVKAPYKDTGSALNSELAAVVVAEILRKLPWYQHSEPLTPITGNFIYAVNWITKRRHLDLVESFWANKTETTDRERELFENTTALYTRSALSDDQTEILSEFLESLPERHRAFADKCLASEELDPADRNRWRTLTRRAAKYGAQREAQDASSAPSVPCGCYRCSRRPWTLLEALRLVDEVGTLPATIQLAKRLPGRHPRSADWQFEPVRTGSYIDPWKSEGRRHNKAKLTDNFQPIPAKLYHQITTGQ